VRVPTSKSHGRMSCTRARARSGALSCPLARAESASLTRSPANPIITASARRVRSARTTSERRLEIAKVRCQAGPTRAPIGASAAPLSTMTPN
jgi:hypothetical protein